MRIATLTLHNALNYGAKLQAYALQQFLLGLGMDTEIIDYYPNPRLDQSKRSLWQKMSHEVSKLYHPFDRIKKKQNKKRMKEFNRRFLRVSSGAFRGDEQIAQNPPQYDIYIAGSDQIWNSEITNNSKAFFLPFVTRGKKIGYAGSFGKSQFGDDEIQNIREFLTGFDYLSVREQHHQKLLADMFGLNAQLVLDPVFLLDKKKWSEIVSPCKLPKKYVFVYAMEYSEEMLDCASKIAKKLNCKVVSLFNTTGKSLHRVGPREFLYAIANASYICTNSFHGTALSIIFEKNFTVFKHTSRNSRIANIIDLAGLNERFFTASCNQEEQIDYQKVKIMMKSHIERSKQFILDAIGNI
jgi:polysaccharide pyruvyl transferase WcaK-like protein